MLFAVWEGLFALSQMNLAALHHWPAMPAAAAAAIAALINFSAARAGLSGGSRTPP
jgi:hypothetical protein